MKPHRRKDTPPRKGPGSDRVEGEVRDGGNSMEVPSSEDTPSYGHSEVEYDPGAALVDENQNYGQAYVDPGQAYVDPGQAYVDPGQAYVDPGQAYVDPGQAYTEAGGGYYPASEENLSGGGVYDEAPQMPHTPPQRGAARTPSKKKVAGRAPKRRPVVPRKSAASSRNRRPKPSYQSGGISVMTVFLGLAAIGMLAIVAMVMRPQDLSGISGYPVSAASSVQPRNLLGDLQKIMTVRASDISFTEEEVNQYLNRRLQGEQRGILASLVKFKGVYIDLSPEMAEVFIEREVFGMPLTMSSKIKTEKFRQQTVYRSAGWTLGRIELGSRTVKPVADLFMRLRAICHDEFQAIQQMSDVVLGEDRITFYSVI